MTDDIALAKQGGFVPFSPPPTTAEETNHPPPKYTAKALNKIYSNLDADDIRSEYKALSTYMADQDSPVEIYMDERLVDSAPKKKHANAAASLAKHTGVAADAPASKGKKKRKMKIKQKITLPPNQDIDEGDCEYPQSQEEILKGSQKLSEAEERHRLFLREISNKRKKDEDLAIQEAIKAAMRRKKFKDALLERR
jgi:hypothetical protein